MVALDRPGTSLKMKTIDGGKAFQNRSAALDVELRVDHVGVPVLEMSIKC